MKRAVITGTLVLGFVVGGATAAHAGETNGHGGYVPGGAKASSACAYSGQDLPDAIEGDIEFGDDFVYGFRERGRVQSYGQFVQFGLKDAVPSPGMACRGNVSFEE